MYRIKRSTAKRLLGLYVVIALWLITGWIGVGIRVGEYTIGVGSGAIVCHTNYNFEGPVDLETWVGRVPWRPEWIWIPHCQREVFSYSYVPGKLVIPVWAFIAAWASFVVVRLQLRSAQRSHRRRHGLCESCGYDLSASTGQTCPECGLSTSITPLAMDGNKWEPRHHLNHKP